MTEAEREQTVEHECAHAAMALCVGVPVDRVEVFTEPRGSRGSRGFANLPIVLDAMDASTARRYALAILAGPAYDDAKGVPDWPIENGGTDEWLIKAFATRAGVISPEAYNTLVAEMWQVTLSKRFARIFTVLCMLMENMWVADERVIDEAKRIAWEDLDEEEPAPRPEVVDIPGPVYDPTARFPVMLAPGTGLTWRFATTDTDDHEPEPYKPFLGPLGATGVGRVEANEPSRLQPPLGSP